MVPVWLEWTLVGIITLCGFGVGAVLWSLQRGPQNEDDD